MELKLHLKPYLKLYLRSGAKIVMDLWLEAAPNAMNSLVYVASHGWMDHHAIQRITLGKWVDLNYNAFGYEECRYLIPGEFQLNPNLEPLTPRPGVICMGGYDEAGPVSAEIFFPLKEFPEFRGIYPVLDEVIKGMDEIRRIAELPTREVIYSGTDKKILEPAEPQIIEWAELEFFGETYSAPVRTERQNLPPCWCQGECKSRQKPSKYEYS